MNLKTVNFIVLAIILVTGVFTFWTAQNDKMMQLYIGIATSVAYVIWGIIFHGLDGDLHPKIVIEYCLVGLIAVILLMTLLLT